MNMANEAIMLELASTDRTLPEVPQIILVFLVINRVRCSNCHRLGHVASNCFRPLNGPEGTYAGSIGHPRTLVRQRVLAIIILVFFRPIHW